MVIAVVDVGESAVADDRVAVMASAPEADSRAKLGARIVTGMRTTRNRAARADVAGPAAGGGPDLRGGSGPLKRRKSIG